MIGEKIDLAGLDVSMNGIEFEDHEFFAAIAERREPRSSMADTLPALATLARLEEQLGRFVAP